MGYLTISYTSTGKEVIMYHETYREAHEFVVGQKRYELYELRDKK